VDPARCGLSKPEPQVPCVPAKGRPHRPRGFNHAPFYYYDGNREARRHPELHPEVWAVKRKLSTSL
jgi:hypothetical protein